MIYLAIIASGLLSLLISYILGTKQSKDLKDKIKKISIRITEMQKEADTLTKEAQTQIETIKNQTEKEEINFLERNSILEEKIKVKNDIMIKKLDRNNSYQQQLTDIKNKTIEIQGNIKLKAAQITESLCSKLQMNKNGILTHIKENTEANFNRLTPIYLEKIEEDFEENAFKEAKNILTFIMQRFTMGSSVDKKDMSITVPNELMKGMLIGKEGNNIEYVERKLDIDVLFNHHGEDAITVSSHDLLKKAIAKETLELLMKEKTITHNLIDKCFEQAHKKINNIMHDMGKKAVAMLGLKDVPEKISDLFGRFEYRTSYGQNIWSHSMEVCFFAAMLADEIGADYQIARLGGYVHDLGKAVDLQIITDEGYQKQIAIELLDENIANNLKGTEGHDDISKIIIDTWQWPKDEKLRERANYAAYCHHDKVPFTLPEDHLVKAADAISASRPGARMESFEWYLQRIKELEELGLQAPHAKKAYSMSAGRELRIIINENEVNDEQLDCIAELTAEKIQTTLSYPGRIKVNIIRITEFKEKVALKQ